MRIKAILLVSATLAITARMGAQSRTAYCFNHSQVTGGSTLLTKVFSVPRDKSAGDSEYQIRQSFDEYLRRVESITATSTTTGCYIYDSDSEARAQLAREPQYAANRGESIRRSPWIYAPYQQSTHSGGAKPTEAEALYDAENFPGPFEKAGDGPISYKTIHRWLSHECLPQPVTGTHGSAKPATYYTCTVTFSYSDEKSPAARTSFGQGDTQEQAVAQAKSDAQTILLDNVRWTEPVCSTFEIAVKNSYKASYGKGGGSTRTRYACEVDSTGTVAVR